MTDSGGLPNVRAFTELGVEELNQDRSAPKVCVSTEIKGTTESRNIPLNPKEQFCSWASPQHTWMQTLGEKGR